MRAIPARLVDRLRLAGPRLAILGLVAIAGTGLLAAQTPAASVAGVTQPEGNDGITDFVFTVTLNAQPTVAASVDWHTVDGTAIAPDDYEASSGTVNFDVGQTEADFTVHVVGDRIYESAEVFYVNLSDPVNCTIQTGSGAGWIHNDDVRISVAGLTQDEGHEGTTDFLFTVTLTDSYEYPVSASWSTEDVTAVAPGDYIASSGTVEFPPGETLATLPVPVVGDRVYESLEYFRVVLSDPANASIGTGSAYGWIANDDVRVSIADLQQLEGNTGTTDFVFTLTLSDLYDVTVGVSWATANGNATAPADYVASSGSVDFPPGETLATLTVPVVADRAYEQQEYFRVVLSDPVNGGIHDGSANGWILNDDVSVSIGPVSLPEGDSGTTDFVFSLTLSGAYEFPVSVDWSTADASAVAPGDYAASSGTVDFPVGETEGSVTVAVVGDLYREVDEYFRVELSDPVNCSLGTAIASGTILNDDEYPAIDVGDISAPEGNVGSTPFEIPVTLSGEYAEEVSVYYRTQEASALDPEDYAYATGLVTFPVGETSASITVNVVGDYDVEPDEQFEIVLFSATHGTIGDGIGAATILNDDAAVALFIGDTSDWEGDSGVTERLFDITLGEASLTSVSVDWATVDGTALAGEDYVAASGTLTLPAGETHGTVPVTVIGDPLDECTEEFTVLLSNPVNAEILDGQGTGTLLDDDLAGCANADGDCYHDIACGGRDCDDADPATYPDAPETHDGIDNQCPGDHGYGVIDEISGVCGFHDQDEVRFSWPAQAAAEAYEVARSPYRGFLAPCALWPPTTATYVDDVETPAPGEYFYYLVRASAPTVGSWGADSHDVERSFDCPNP